MYQMKIFPPIFLISIFKVKRKKEPNWYAIRRTKNFNTSLTRNKLKKATSSHHEGASTFWFNPNNEKQVGLEYRANWCMLINSFIRVTATRTDWNPPLASKVNGLVQSFSFLLLIFLKHHHRALLQLVTLQYPNMFILFLQPFQVHCLNSSSNPSSTPVKFHHSLFEFIVEGTNTRIACCVIPVSIKWITHRKHIIELIWWQLLVMFWMSSPSIPRLAVISPSCLTILFLAASSSAPPLTRSFSFYFSLSVISLLTMCTLENIIGTLLRRYIRERKLKLFET